MYVCGMLCVVRVYMYDVRVHVLIIWRICQPNVRSLALCDILVYCLSLGWFYTVILF